MDGLSDLRAAAERAEGIAYDAEQCAARAAHDARAARAEYIYYACEEYGDINYMLRERVDDLKRKAKSIINNKYAVDAYHEMLTEWNTMQDQYRRLLVDY